MRMIGSRILVIAMLLWSEPSAIAADWSFQSRSGGSETLYTAGTDALQFSCTRGGEAGLKIFLASSPDFRSYNKVVGEATIGGTPSKTGVFSRFTNSSPKPFLLLGSKFDTGPFGLTSASYSGRKALEIAAQLVDYDLVKLSIGGLGSDLGGGSRIEGSPLEVTVPLGGAAGPIRQLLQACNFQP